MRIALASFSDIENDPRVRRQVETFLAEGWDVHALAMGGLNEHRDLKLSRSRIQRRRAGRLRYLLEYLGFALHLFVWVTSLVLRSRVDLIYVNSPPDVLTLACIFARIRGVPVVLDVHDPMPELWSAKGNEAGLVGSVLKAQERVGIHLSDAVITVHEPMRELIEQRNPGTGASVVMNVPNLEIVPERRRDDTRVVVFSGTVAFRYGLDDLVAAMSRVKGEIPGISLRIVGDGEDLDRLADIADTLKVPTEFHGRVPWEDVAQLQRDAWVGANVPKPDALGELSFSNKIVEWVAAGIPVVASHTRTMATYFPEGTLYYAEAGDPESIAAALLAVHESSELEIENQTRRAGEALAAIGWPRQRAELLRVVRETAQLG